MQGEGGQGQKATINRDLPNPNQRLSSLWRTSVKERVLVQNVFLRRMCCRVGASRSMCCGVRVRLPKVPEVPECCRVLVVVVVVVLVEVVVIEDVVVVVVPVLREYLRSHGFVE